MRIVLVGPPNAGKSSLLNWFVGREAAIVSPQAGTTRDVVEAPIVLGGLPVVVTDTAGLREGSVDVIEQEGMRRTRMAADGADILLWLEASDEHSSALPPRSADFLVQTKVDLGFSPARWSKGEKVWPVSVKSGAGLEALRHALEELIRERNHLGEDAVMVRERHRLALAAAREHLGCALAVKSQGLEFMAEDMRKAAAVLAGITGAVAVEDVLGEIFSAFCIGK